jgi:hypothetical protein
VALSPRRAGCSAEGFPRKIAPVAWWARQHFVAAGPAANRGSMARSFSPGKQNCLSIAYEPPPGIPVIIDVRATGGKSGDSEKADPSGRGPAGTLTSPRWIGLNLFSIRQLIGPSSSREPGRDSLKY